MKSMGRGWWPVLVAAAMLGLPAAGRGPRAESSSRRAPQPDHRVSAERLGVVPTAGGHRLNLTADSGSVHIFTDSAIPSSSSAGTSDTGEVRYRVRVEAAAGDPDAAKLLKQFALVARKTPDGVEITGRMPSRDDMERVWVSYEVHVPRRYDLEISTGAGDIETQDIDGRVIFSTGGGTIRAGRIGGSASASASSSGEGGHDAFAARLQTGGGHIFVGDVAGALRASTAGGHIVAGNVNGDAVLRTEGGHIQVGRVSGKAQLSTGGGNIVAEGADGGVQADSAGGRIELGEASGAIQARTSGGGIRIGRLAGPTNLDSSDGGIFLAGVAAPLHASTASGTITAWFSPTFSGAASDADADGGGGRIAKRAGAHGAAGSELVSRAGNIVVYLPRAMAVTIDAVVEQSGAHRIVVDPSLPIQVKYYEDAAGGRAERGECALNGGGEVLHLRADAGDIELRVLDPRMAQRLAEQQAQEVVNQLEAQRAILSGMQGAAGADAASTDGAASANVPDEIAAQPTYLFWAWSRWFDELWWGGVRVAPEDQQKRLVRSAAPIYPDIAQQAGIEGEVTLRILVGPDGTVKDVRAVAGDPVLARAAVDAVEQWRYAPAMLGGQPVGVMTTITLAFRLHY